MVIGFIGTGNMGGAILKGYIKARAKEKNTILIHNRSSEHNEQMAAAAVKASVDTAPDVSAADGEKVAESGVIGGRLDLRVCNDNRELAEIADVVIIGVKPDGVTGVLKEIAPELVKGHRTDEKVLISMAAGVSIAEMETALNEAKEGLGDEIKIIRAMPNIPAQVGEAMTSLSRNKNVDEEDFLKAKEIFAAVGTAEEVDEELIHCVIGVSGSSPAYTFMYIEALVQAAIANGMGEKKARVFAAESVKGAAEMVLNSNESLEQLRINVCSPKGTTIEAVNTLKRNGFMDNVKEGFQAAVDRSEEMTSLK